MHRRLLQRAGRMRSPHLCRRFGVDGRCGRSTIQIVGRKFFAVTPPNRSRRQDPVPVGAFSNSAQHTSAPGEGSGPEPSAEQLEEATARSFASSSSSSSSGSSSSAAVPVLDLPSSSTAAPASANAGAPSVDSGPTSTPLEYIGQLFGFGGRKTPVAGDAVETSTLFTKAKRRRKTASASSSYLSFADARAVARNLCLVENGKHGAIWWQEAIELGGIVPKTIPAKPHNSYRSEWTGWQDWLGYGSSREAAEEGRE